LHGLLAIADHIGGDLGHEVESRTAACAQELEQLLDDWTAAVGTAINARHHSLEQLAQKAVEAIHEEGTTTMTSLEGASHALEAAHQQFDQAAGEVESSHATVSTVAGLAPGVQKAEGEVAEIRALLDSVGTP
jgi:chromosome segregation ATPase